MTTITEPSEATVGPSGHLWAWKTSSRVQQVAQVAVGEAAVPSRAATVLRFQHLPSGPGICWGWPSPVEPQHPLEENVVLSKTAPSLSRRAREAPENSQETRRFFTGAEVGT